VARTILTLLLMLSLPAALRAADPPPAAALDADTLAMVKTFLKLPTEKLPAAHVGRFLGVDPGALPEKLRKPFLAKRLELYTLKQIADGKKRGTVRMPEEKCSAPIMAQGNSAGILLSAGFVEIYDDEEKFVMDKTNCTENDLQCEFTLQIVIEKKGNKTFRRLFLHERDPIMAIVGQYRDAGKTKQTNFFGIGFPACAPRLK